MTVSIRTLSRMALVAAGLALSAPAMAATATIDCGTGTPSWNSNTSTLSCGAGGSKCTISGPSSAVVSTQFTLNASCPSGTNYNWTGSGAASCSGASCDVTEGTTGNKTYAVSTETTGSLSNNFVVNITSGAVAPSGCSLTASPTSGPSGTNVTLTANCTSGTSPIAISWGGASGTGGCPTSFTIGTPATCAISNVTANSTWQASFSNGGGSAGNNPRSASFTVQSGGGGNFAGCPSGTLTIDGQWGQTAIDTAQFGEFGGNIMSIHVQPPGNFTGLTTRTSSWGEYAGPPTVREAVFSNVPCDFSNANALKTSLGVVQRSVDAIGFAFKYRAGNSSTSAVGLVAGQSYYINVRNYYSTGQPSCTGDCRMRGGLPQ